MNGDVALPIISFNSTRIYNLLNRDAPWVTHQGMSIAFTALNMTILPTFSGRVRFR